MNATFKILSLVTILLLSITSSAQVNASKKPTQFLPGTVIRSYCVHHASDQNMLIGTKGKAGDGKIYQTKNGGDSWEPLNGGKALSDSCEDVQTVRYANEKTIVAGTWKNGMFISNDAGASFKAVESFPSKDIRSIIRSPRGYLYAATTTHGIFVSEDNGHSWSCPHGNKMVKELACWKMKMPPKSNSILYALTFQGGIYKSIDGGENWKQVLHEKDVMIYDIDFIENEIYAIGSNDNGNFMFRSYMGDKNWKQFKLNMPGSANSLHLMKTFYDYMVYFGTWSSGIYDTYAIEYGIEGFRCNEVIEDDTIGVADLYSNEKYVYNFTWGDGVKRYEREEECGIEVPNFAAPGSTKFDPFKLTSTCKLDYYSFRLFDRFGKELFTDEADIKSTNAKMNKRENFKESSQYIYWIKASFEENVDTISMNGHIQVVLD